MLEAGKKNGGFRLKNIKTVVFLFFVLTLKHEAGYSMERLTAVTLEYPPFNYTDKQTKEIVGASPALLRKMFKDLGYELEIHSLPWKRSQIYIKTGKAQIIFTYTRSRARQKVAYYSNPISTIKAIFIKNINSQVPSRWEKLSDLRHYIIGINGGYNYPPVFMRALENTFFPKLEIISSKNPTIQNLEKLLRNRIDYYICPVDCQAEIYNLSQENQNKIEKMERTVGGERTFHVGFAKNHTFTGGKPAVQIRQEFNDLFDQYLKQGKINFIYEKYNIDVNYDMLGSKLSIDWDNTLD